VILLSVLPPTEELTKLWVDEEFHFDLPFTFTLFPTPGVGFSIEAIRRTIEAFLKERKRNNPTNVLSVSQCVNRILENQLNPGDQVWVSAISPEVIPSKITYYPPFRPNEKFVEVSIGKGAAAFSKSVGKEFFSGQTCHQIYLTEVNWDQASFLKVFFPSARINPDYLKIINNRGVLIFGEIDNTTLTYPCVRTEKIDGKTTISEFTEQCHMAVMVKAVYTEKQWDTLPFLKKLDNKTSYERMDDAGELSIYWLRGIESEP
jgi:hypothetical protein